jgi:hypothetical protein
MSSPGNALNIKSAGVVTFATPATFSGSTITNNGLVLGGASNALQSLAVAASGTMLQGASGANPSFTATPAVTSITLGAGTLLNEYQQLSYTPVLKGQSTAGSVTYVTQVGVYTRIGNLVFLSFNITTSAVSGGSGQINITLPVNNGATVEGHGVVVIDGVTFSGYLLARTPTSFGSMQIMSTTSTGTSTPVNITAVPNAASIRGTVVYQTT